MRTGTADGVQSAPHTASCSATLRAPSTVPYTAPRRSPSTAPSMLPLTAPSTAPCTSTPNSIPHSTDGVQPAHSTPHSSANARGGNFQKGGRQRKGRGWAALPSSCECFDPVTRWHQAHSVPQEAPCLQGDPEVTGAHQGVTIVVPLFLLRCGLGMWHKLASPYTCCLRLLSAQLAGVCHQGTLASPHTHTSSSRGHTGTAASPLLTLPETGLFEELALSSVVNTRPV